LFSSAARTWRRGSPYLFRFEKKKKRKHGKKQSVPFAKSIKKEALDGKAAEKKRDLPSNSPTLRRRRK